MNDFSLPADDQATQEPPIDQDALKRFAAGASSHSTDQAMPWDEFDPTDKPTLNVSIRLNQYELAILRHLAAQADISQSKILRRITVPALAQLLEEANK
jgi:hypothetical protein